MPRLPRAEHRELQETIDRVVSAVDLGHIAWQTGSFCHDHVNALVDGQRRVAQALARFEDRQLILEDCTLNFLRHYEQMATDLMDGAEALRGERREERHRLPTGEYAVSRQLMIGDRLYVEARICANPAVASIYLDQWEAQIRNSALLP
jgi:hypothetical protein